MVIGRTHRVAWRGTSEKPLVSKGTFKGPLAWRCIPTNVQLLLGRVARDCRQQSIAIDNGEHLCGFCRGRRVADRSGAPPVPSRYSCSGWVVEAEYPAKPLAASDLAVSCAYPVRPDGEQDPVLLPLVVSFHMI